MRLRAPLLLCLLVGCSLAWDEDPLEANIVRPGSFKAGSGMIVAVELTNDGRVVRVTGTTLNKLGTGR